MPPFNYHEQSSIALKYLKNLKSLDALSEYINHLNMCHPQRFANTLDPAWRKNRITDAGNICLRAFTEVENNYAIALTFATRTEDHLTDLLDFFISETVKVDKFIALGTGGFPRSGNGRNSTRRRRK
jgi:hypothetical protein